MKTQTIHLFALVILFVGSCNRGTLGGDDANERTPTALADYPVSVETTGAVGSGNHRNASLTQGHITVFGLALPNGMTPVKSPERVYRFEGNFSAASVFTEMKRQVSSRRIATEQNGYLIREAKVRRPKGKASGDEVLAIRIARPERGGTVLDIWLDKAEMARTAARASARRRSNANKEPQSVKAPNRVRAQRAKSRREVNRLLQRQSRGEKLTKEELARIQFD